MTNPSSGPLPDPQHARLDPRRRLKPTLLKPVYIDANGSRNVYLPRPQKRSQAIMGVFFVPGEGPFKTITGLRDWQGKIYKNKFQRLLKQNNQAANCFSIRASLKLLDTKMKCDFLGGLNFATRIRQLGEIRLYLLGCGKGW